MFVTDIKYPSLPIKEVAQSTSGFMDVSSSSV
jgi:hypothetical protein